MFDRYSPELAVPEPPRDRRPPFLVLGPTRSAWRETVLTRVSELWFLLEQLDTTGQLRSPEARLAIEAHLHAAERAVLERRPWWPSPKRRATLVERALGHLDAAEASLLRIGPESYVVGQLPSLLAQVRSHLPKGDARLERLEAIATTYAPCPPPELCAADRDAVVAAFRAGALEARRELTRLQSFCKVLYRAALAMTVGAVALAVVGLCAKRAVPLCFTPGDAALVCPVKSHDEDFTKGKDARATRREHQVALAVASTTSPGDVALVELLGLLAAAVAGAAALRGIRGTSTPYDIPLATAVLKLPTGALTAVLGLLLLRGGFVPGLSDLDNSGQILAWAVIFGYAQQLFTGMVDRQAQGVLKEVGTPGTQKVSDGSTVPS
jgi:hypothetical protein